MTGPFIRAWFLFMKFARRHESAMKRTKKSLPGDSTPIEMLEVPITIENPSESINEDVEMSYRAFQNEQELVSSAQKASKRPRRGVSSSVSVGSNSAREAFPIEFDPKLYRFTDTELLRTEFPKELESDLACAIFELGLRHSSPKVLMGLMSEVSELTSEHIKSHLQKYRIHHDRSKEEFLTFYRDYVQELFRSWEQRKGWEAAPHIAGLIHSSGSMNRFGVPDQGADTATMASAVSGLNLEQQQQEAETLLSEWPVYKTDEEDVAKAADQEGDSPAKLYI